MALPRIAHVVEIGLVQSWIGVCNEYDVFDELGVGRREGELVGGADAEGVGAVQHGTALSVELATGPEEGEADGASEGLGLRWSGGGVADDAGFVSWAEGASVGGVHEYRAGDM